MPRNSLVNLVHVSTPTGDYIGIDHMYQSYMVCFEGLDMRVDHLPFSLVDFNVILGMDWLLPCHDISDGHAMNVKLR